MESIFDQRLSIQLCLLLAYKVCGTAAALEFTNSFNGLTAGAPFNLTWSGASGTTTLNLLSGTSSDEVEVDEIAFGVQNEFILWSPYAFTPAGTYVLRLDDTSGQTTNSPQFNMLAAGSNPSATTLHFTNTEYDIVVGSPFNVTWEGGSGTTTLSLQQGTADSISNADTIAFGITPSYIVWTPYATTQPGQYILRLDDTSGESAYGLVFDMQGPGSTSSAAILSPSVSSNPTPTSDPTSASTTAKLPSSTSNIPSSNTLFISTAQSSASISTSPSTLFTSLATLLFTSPPPSSFNPPATSAFTNKFAASATISTYINTDINTGTSSSAIPTDGSATASSPASSITATKSSLSAGAKAGIGIACSLAAVFLCTTIILLYRRRKAFVEPPQELPAKPMSIVGVPGIVGYYGPDAAPKNFVNGATQEMDANRQVHEMGHP